MLSPDCWRRASAQLVAGACGLALGLAGCGGPAGPKLVPVVGKGLANILPMFYFPGRDVVLGIAICAALGVATGIFPALAAMRLRVADALRRM